MRSRRFVQPETWLTCELALVGGYCDAASFVLTKTFTGHVTGNLVLAAISVAAHDWNRLSAHSLAIVIFLLGTWVSMLFLRRYQIERPSLLFASIMLLEGVLVGCASRIKPADTFPKLLIFVILMSLGLGLQNGSFTRFAGISVHTTYITGVITSLLSGSAAKQTRKLTNGSEPAVRLLGYVWFWFAAGAGCGAAMVLQCGSSGLLGAPALLGVIAWMEV